jgi:hypothetical protein
MNYQLSRRTENGTFFYAGPYVNLQIAEAAKKSLGNFGAEFEIEISQKYYKGVVGIDPRSDRIKLTQKEVELVVEVLDNFEPYWEGIHGCEGEIQKATNIQHALTILEKNPKEIYYATPSYIVAKSRDDFNYYGVIRAYRDIADYYMDMTNSNLYILHLYQCPHEVMGAF